MMSGVFRLVDRSGNDDRLILATQFLRACIENIRYGHTEPKLAEPPQIESFVDELQQNLGLDQELSDSG